MKKLLYLVPLLVLVLGASLSAATTIVPIGQWKMDQTVIYQASTNRYAVLSEIDPAHRFALGESADNPNYPVLTPDGGGASGLAGDKAVDFTSNMTRAFCSEFRLGAGYLGYPGPTLDMAFEMWIKSPDVSTTQTVVYTSTKWEIRVDAGQLKFFVYPGPASVSTAITANAWHHVYAECVGQDLLLTVDGVTVSKTDPGINGIIVDTTRLYAGATSGTTPVRPYMGLLDELTIYEAVKGADETIAHTPIPSDGDDTVDPAAVTQLQWQTPLTQSDPNGDPNLVSIDKFDLTIYSKLTANVTGDDPNFIGVTTVPDVTSPYPITLDYDTTYFWRVDTHRTWDSNDFTGTASLSEIVTGANWQFATMTAAPTVSQQPIGVRAFTSDPAVVFTCQFSSASAPTVLWYQVGNATPLSTGGDIVISTVNDGGNDYTTTLQILTPALADEGDYYCTIDNGTLVQSDDAYLIINQLLAQYDFDGTLAAAVGSLADAPTGQGMTTDGLAEPNELLASPSAVSYVTGVNGLGLAVSIDPNDYVNFSTNGYPRAGSLVGGFGRGLDAGTMIYWIKPSVNGQVLANYNDGTLTGFSTNLTGSNPTQSRIYVRGENADGSANVVLANNITGNPDRPGWDMYDGAWHMVAATWEAGDQANVYVDGQPVATGNAGTPAQYMPWNRNVLLGAGRTTADRNILNAMMSGAVDNLRIYNYRLDIAGNDVFAQEYYDNTGIVPCLNSNFVGKEFNFDNTGTSYCTVDLVDYAKFAEAWLAGGLWSIP